MKDARAAGIKDITMPEAVQTTKLSPSTVAALSRGMLLGTVCVCVFFFFSSLFVLLTKETYANQGKKKMPLMLLQWQPCLGRGTTRSLKEPVLDQEAGMRLNYVGPPEASL